MKNEKDSTISKRIEYNTDKHFFYCNVCSNYSENRGKNKFNDKNTGVNNLWHKKYFLQHEKAPEHKRSLEIKN